MVVLCFIVLATAPSYVMLAHLSIFRYLGFRLLTVTCFSGKLVFGICLAYFYSIDGVIILLMFLLMLISVNSTSKWLLEMVW
jgi:hypothetical protein